jgi:O-antigen/teichoic acid export membrane protein
MAAVNYFVILADYGFNLSATKAVAASAGLPTERSRIFWNTIAVKALLAALGLPVLLSIGFLVPSLRTEISLLLIAYLTVVGSVLTPAWFFQGCERQSTLSGISVAVRISAVPITFWLVRTPADLPLAIAIAASCPVVTGSVALLLLAREGVVHPCSLSLRDMLATFKDGWHLFLSQVSTSLYTTSNAVLLGIVSGPTAVGYYNSAERLTQATQALLSPINQSVFPRMSRLMSESKADAHALIRVLLWKIGGLAFCLSAALFLAAPLIVPRFYGATFAPAISVLRWLAPLPFIVALSNVFGLHTMIPMGMKRSFTAILLAGGFLNILLLIVLAGRFGAVGAAASVSITECLITIAMALHLWRRAVPIFGPHAATQPSS